MKWVAVASAVFIVGVFVALGPQQLRMYKEHDVATALARKASIKAATCKAVGDYPFSIRGKVLVTGPSGPYMLDGSIDNFLSQGTRKTEYRGPVTVFFLDLENVEIGKYSISGQSGYQQRANICVVQFNGIEDTGTAVSAHVIWGQEPSYTRPVGNSPSFGNLEQAAIVWIHSTPQTDN